MTKARDRAALELIEQAIEERHWLAAGSTRPWSNEDVFDLGDRLVRLNYMLVVLNALPPEKAAVEKQSNPLVSEIIA